MTPWTAPAEAWTGPTRHLTGRQPQCLSQGPAMRPRTRAG